MIPTLLVYDSGFSISAASATLDLSQSAARAPTRCAKAVAARSGWVCG